MRWPGKGFVVALLEIWRAVRDLSRTARACRREGHVWPNWERKVRGERRYSTRRCQRCWRRQYVLDNGHTHGPGLNEPLRIPERLDCGHPSGGGLVFTTLDGSTEPSREVLVITCPECRRPQQLMDFGEGHRLTGTVRIYRLPPEKTH